MSTPHTPGPWSVYAVEYGSEVTDKLCILASSPNFRDVASIAECFQGDRIKDMEQANARLIAAAPDLLDALIAMVDEPQPLGITRPAYKGALTAIAKATGDAP